MSDWDIDFLSDWDVEFYGLSLSMGWFYKLVFDFAKDMYHLCQGI